MRTRTLFALALSLALAAAGTFAAAQVGTIEVGEPKPLSLTSDVKIGNMLVGPGEYRVRHLIRGDEHIMVFVKAASLKEVARTNCTMKKLEQRASATRLRYRVDEDGTKLLRELVFEGDDARHVFF